MYSVDHIMSKLFVSNIYKDLKTKILIETFKIINLMVTQHLDLVRGQLI